MIAIYQPLFLQATKYLLDPLTAPEPSEETGPGSHFVREESTAKSPIVSTTAQKRAPSSSYPTPPTSASPTRSNFHSSNPYAASPHRQAAFGAYSSADPNRKNPDLPIGNGKGRRRGSKLWHFAVFIRRTAY